MKYRVALFSLLLAAAALPHDVAAKSKSLRGSSASMKRQNEVARKNDYSFLRTPTQVKAFVDKGRLVRLEGNDDYRLAGVSYPYGRPEVKLFVERLASDYHAACGEQLVVTSVTRPISRQPKNANPLSVHPAGMAVDLRVSSNSDCLSWLQNTLLDLEGQDLLDVTREYHPSHLHVAVFPQAYREHVEKLIAEETAKLPPIEETPVPVTPTPALTASVLPQSSRWQLPALVAAAAILIATAVGLIRKRRSN